LKKKLSHIISEIIQIKNSNKKIKIAIKEEKPKIFYSI